MRVIELDASTWTSALDVYRELGHAATGGQAFACNVNAILDCMIGDWEGTGIERPYMIRLVNAEDLPAEVKDEIALLASLLKESQGGHLEVFLEWPPGALQASPEERLGAAETDLVGSWIMRNGRAVCDPVEQRIRWLIKNYLREVRTSPDGWSVLYRDPNDGRYWERTYPHSEVHGGGPMQLTMISAEDAREKFGLSH